jgi:hypothetical protein
MRPSPRRWRGEHGRRQAETLTIEEWEQLSQMMAIWELDKTNMAQHRSFDGSSRILLILSALPQPAAQNSLKTPAGEPLAAQQSATSQWSIRLGGRASVS